MRWFFPRSIGLVSFAVVILALAACGSGESETRVAPEQPPESIVASVAPTPEPDAVAEERVLILGDSLSAAYNIALADGWVSLLQARLTDRGCDAAVINASISGETTSGGSRRLPELLDRHQATIVMIELGGNDGLRGLSLEAFTENMRSMVSAAQQAGADVLVTPIQIPPNYGARYTERFEQTYRNLATEFGVTLMPFILRDVALEPGLMQSDGIHPNALAQPVILDTVWPSIEPMLACS